MKTVFVDVDTQFDFLFPAGALYVPEADRILPLLERLARQAAAHGIPVLSTTDAHAEDDVEFASWPPHCVAGTLGQRKPAALLLEPRVVVPNQDAPLRLEGARQIVLEKQTVNAFATRTMERVLESLAADRYVVYGVATEVCVLCAARGLLAAGKQVTVVADAIRGITAVASDEALEEIRRRGGLVVNTAEILSE
jgi:nicotinamidase/pyrazinamidase